MANLAGEMPLVGSQRINGQANITYTHNFPLSDESPPLDMSKGNSTDTHCGDVSGFRNMLRLPRRYFSIYPTVVGYEPRASCFRIRTSRFIGFINLGEQLIL